MFQRGGHRLMHAVGFAALDEVRRISISNEQGLELFVADAGQDRGVVDLVAIEMKTGSTAPSVIGLTNLLLCQLVASGPVSDSPSPTITRVIKSGWSNTVP